MVIYFEILLLRTFIFDVRSYNYVTLQPQRLNTSAMTGCEKGLYDVAIINNMPLMLCVY